MRKNKRRHFVNISVDEIEQINDDFYDCLAAFIDDLKLKTGRIIRLSITTTNFGILRGYSKSKGLVPG